ncbi:response regulator transcription factor [Caldinitratiruptor microaerophilus]|uniref:Stage 0 sporulation protein A homolog n=1 Tax=Caldinitratiruptor microaerophilus TaxID=671077 RepID=A0AA35CLG1_9FIRM|nr:response regulator transcription factor [Caldinitratiruptor microaerophilus]BDG60699.1 DNA-binding response regulator [Caldinitratiruptor microaerophilus]
MPDEILVVEDEQPIRDLIAFNLERAGYRVVTTADGVEALSLARERRPALIILDLMLPGMDGIDVCREVRRSSDVPILMLTARRDEIDRVVGFEVGADDYVTKPFSPRELVSRVRAILRRTAPRPVERPSGTFGSLHIDYERFEVTRDGERVDLTLTEFQILRVMSQQPGRVFTRDELLDRVRGQEFAADPRTIDVHIRHLRAKIEPDPSRPTYIETVRGVGYRFRGSST